MQRRNKFLIVPQPKTQCRLENDVLGLSCTAHACACVSVCAACIMYMSCSICLCLCAQAGLHRGTSILSMISNLLDQPFSHCSLSRPRQGVSSIPLVHGWPHGWGCQEAGELLHLSQSDAFPPSSLPPALLSTCSAGLCAALGPALPALRLALLSLERWCQCTGPAWSRVTKCCHRRRDRDGMEALEEVE